MVFNKNKSLVCYRENPKANTRLICFPCAGGGASMYRRWADLFPNSEVWCANYPGRESLHSQPFAENLDDVIDVLTQEPDWFLNQDYVFYGHSFGALVAFSVAIKLNNINQFEPKGLCVSARRAPHLPARKTVSHLPEPEFIADLNQYGGIPDSIRNNKDMMDFYLPIIRADLKLNDFGQSHPEEQVNCPIHLFSADQDHVANRAELDAWQSVTKAHFKHRIFSGGHFFIQEQEKAFTAALNTSMVTFKQDDDEDLIAF